MKPRKVIICGGGISGLTAAICFAKNGWNVGVFEQAQQLSAVGLGIQISPNAIRILNEIGILAAIEEKAFFPEFVRLSKGQSGKKLVEISLNDAEQKWGAPYITILRSDLIEALKDRLRQLKPNALMLGARIVNTFQETANIYEHNSGCVKITTETGDKFEADLLIAADGVNSTIRAEYFQEARKSYTGYSALRSLVSVDKFSYKNLLPPRGSCVWSGEKKHCVTTYVDAGKTINFAGIIEIAQPQKELNEQDCKLMAQREFGDWNKVIRELCEKSDGFNLWPIFEVDSLPKYHEGRVVLIGDAAHSMIPSAAQGGVLAIEDAYILSRIIDTSHDIFQALENYSSLRLSRIKKIRSISRDNINTFHGKGIKGGLVNIFPQGVTNFFAAKILNQRLNWLYGYNPAK